MQISKFSTVANRDTPQNASVYVNSGMWGSDFVPDHPSEKSGICPQISIVKKKITQIPGGQKKKHTQVGVWKKKYSHQFCKKK